MNFNENIERDNRSLVTGIGVVCSAGIGKEQLLESIVSGKSGIGPIKRFDTAGCESHNAGVVDYLKLPFYDYDRDLCVNFAINAVEEALEDAGLDRKKIQSSKVALCLGIANSGIDSLEKLLQKGLNSNRSYSQYPAHRITDEIREYFGIGGPCFTFTSACTASSAAIGFSVDLVESGEYDIVVAGGSDALALAIYAGFQSLKSVSDSICSPYDKKIGLSLGEGAGILVIESESSATNRVKKPVCRLISSGSSLDAFHITSPDPTGDGVARSLISTMNSGSLNRSEVGYINTHGTGTQANDGAELRGLKKVFSIKNEFTIPVSSSKSYFGHTLGAAGAIELISSILCLRKNILPSTLNSEEIRLDCQNFNIVTRGIVKSNAKDFVTTNSAFGGHNTSILATIRDSKALNCFYELKKRVYIVGMARVSDSQGISVEHSWDIRNDNKPQIPFKLKNELPRLYKRRMSSINQFAIGSVFYALKDSDCCLSSIDPSKFGVYFSTSLGSSNVQQNYLKDLYSKGPKFIKCVQFPEMVLNSTLGQIAATFGFKGCGANLSDGGSESLKATWVALYDLQKGKINGAVVTSAEDESELSNKIYNSLSQSEQIEPIKVHNSSTSTILVNEAGLDDAQEVYAEILNFFSICLNDSNEPGELVQLVNERGEKLDFIITSCSKKSIKVKLNKFLINSFKDVQLISCDQNMKNNVVIPSHDCLNLAAYLVSNRENKFDKKFHTGMTISIGTNGTLTGCIVKKYTKIEAP